MWTDLIRIYWQICTFKRSPADSPYGQLLLSWSAVLFWLLLLLQWKLVNRGASTALDNQIYLLSSVILFAYALYSWLILTITRKRNRFVQTLTALFACHSLIHLLAVPLLFLMPVVGTLGVYFFNLLLLLVSMVLSIWQFMISAYIFRHALQIGGFASMIASLGLIAVNLLMISLW